MRDLNGKTYERHPSFRQRERLYRRLVPSDCQPAEVLDVGGTLASASFLAELFPNARITVQNVRREDLDAIPSDLAATAKLGTAETLPYTDDSFSLVFCGEVLEHLPYPNKFLEEAARVLSPGGLILLSTPNLASWHNRVLLAFGFSPSNYSMMPGRHLGLPALVSRRLGLGYGDHIRVFTYRALRQLFNAAPWQMVGIASQNCTDLGRPARRLRQILNLLPADAREDVFVCARNIKEPVLRNKRA